MLRQSYVHARCGTEWFCFGGKYGILAELCQMKSVVWLLGA